MTNQWHDPIDFSGVELLTPEHLNKYLRDNFEYLFQNPVYQQRRVQSPSYSTSATSPTAMDTTNLRLNVTLPRQMDLVFWASFGYVHNTTGNANRNGYADIRKDGTTNLSGGTWLYRHAELSQMQRTAYIFIVEEDVAAGNHYYDLMWHTNADTIQTLSDQPAIFGVKGRN